MCEKPIYEIEMSYAKIISIMYNSIFYSTVLPMGIFWSIISLSFYYWSEKVIFHLLNNL